MQSMRTYAVRMLYVYMNVFYVLECLYAGARDTAHAIPDKMPRPTPAMQQLAGSSI